MMVITTQDGQTFLEHHGSPFWHGIAVILDANPLFSDPNNKISIDIKFSQHIYTGRCYWLWSQLVLWQQEINPRLKATNVRSTRLYQTPSSPVWHWQRHKIPGNLIPNPCMQRNFVVIAKYRIKISTFYPPPKTRWTLFFRAMLSRVHWLAYAVATPSAHMWNILHQVHHTMPWTCAYIHWLVYALRSHRRVAAQCGVAILSTVISRSTPPG